MYLADCYLYSGRKQYATKISAKAEDFLATPIDFSLNFDGMHGALTCLKSITIALKDIQYASWPVYLT